MKIVDELGSNILVKNHHCTKLYNNVTLKFLKLRIFNLAAEIVYQKKLRIFNLTAEIQGNLILCFLSIKWDN